MDSNRRITAPGDTMPLDASLRVTPIGRFVCPGHGSINSL